MVRGVFSISFESVDALTGRSPLRRFIGGDENLLVRAACDDSLSSSPRFTPLVFFGPTGTGKSLLAQGLIQHWSQQHADQSRNGSSQVTELSGADFARSFAHAIETDSVTELRERWEGSQRFLVEDVQQLANKSAAQQELSRLIDVLHAQGRAILATMNTLPAEAEGLSNALISRLSGGLTVPVAPPGLEARREIVASLATLYGYELSEPTIRLLTEGDPVPFATAPELQHALSHLMLMAERDGEDSQIDEKLVRQLLDNEKTQQPTLRSICQATAKHFQLKAADLRGSSRRQSISHARSIAMHLCRHLTDASFEQIGKYFGKRDHTTVMHACRQAETRRNADLAVEADCELLLQKLSSS